MRWPSIVLALLVVALQYPLWIGKGGWLRVWEVEKQLSASKEANRRLEQRNSSLEAEVRDLKTGYEAVEERARFELGLTRPDEVFVQTPQGHIEAAMALGATRWEMIRMVVFPYARPGMISAAMLGLGRALGETIAVALLLSALFEINWHITEPGGNTFAANIALKWNEAGELGLSALVASGLVLFLITLGVNMAARLIVARKREFVEGH